MIFSATGEMWAGRVHRIDNGNAWRAVANGRAAIFPTWEAANGWANRQHRELRRLIRDLKARRPDLAATFEAVMDGEASALHVVSNLGDIDRRTVEAYRAHGAGFWRKVGHRERQGRNVLLRALGRIKSASQAQAVTP